MKLFLAGSEIMNKIIKENYYGIEIKIENHLHSYFYLKNKPNYIKDLKNENKQK